MPNEEQTRTMPKRFDTDGRPPEEVPGIVDHLREYAVQRPEVAALWCFGIGFVLGWKLKPW